MKLIDADPLIKWCVYCADDDIIKVDRHVMANMLDHAPEIDPVKHGRWVEDSYYDITCSKCGKRPLFCFNEEDYDFYPCLSEFCPNCGSLMDMEATE